MRKSRDEVIQSILKRFENGTSIVNTEPGGIVRTFSEVLSEEFSQLYDELNLISTMAFVSTARGQFLDLLGSVLDCSRLTNENDENYRMRITNHVYVVAGANQIAIRIRLLEVPGVSDVLLKPFTKGTGSFTAYIITEKIDTPDDILYAAHLAAEKYKAFGIFAEVKTPVLVRLRPRVRLILKDGVSNSEAQSIRENTKAALKEYADNLGLGGSFIVTEAIRRMKNVSGQILDLSISQMHVDGVERFVRNISAGTGERVFLEQVDII